MTQFSASLNKGFVFTVTRSVLIAASSLSTAVAPRQLPS